MNVLDENIPDDQYFLLQRKRVRVRKVGREIGRKGMADDEIIPLLHELNRATFFTLDEDFYDKHLCHPAYCLVHLDVVEEKAAEFVRRILRHQALKSKAKRMGLVIQTQPKGIRSWRIHEKTEKRFGWQE